MPDDFIVTSMSASILDVFIYLSISSRISTICVTFFAFPKALFQMSSILLAKLEYGVSKSSNRNKNRTALLQFASAFDLLDFNDIDTEVFGVIQQSLKEYLV